MLPLATPLLQLSENAAAGVPPYEDVVLLGPAVAPNGKFGVFIPDYQETETSPYFRKLGEDGWEDWFKGGVAIKPVLTGDGSIVGKMPSTK